MEKEFVPPNPNLLSRIELIEKFGWEEYFIFALMLAVSAGIGIFFYIKGQHNNAEFIMGGKSMGTLPMTLSLVASFMSAITLLGTPAEMYTQGTQYCALVLSYPLVMASAAYMFMPVFYKLGVSTSYEYLEWRFNKAVRILASCCFTLQMVLYMAIVVYAPALGLAQITGFDVNIACVVIFVVCIFYTTLGGIKAVMWTDTFQAIMMFGSFLAVIIKGNFDVGGSQEVFDANYQTGRIELFNFSFDMTDRHTLWGLIIGGYFTWISVYGINQTQVQRYLTVPKMEMAVKALWWNCLGIGSLLLMCAYGGLVVFAYYFKEKCDPIKAMQVSTKDQIFPIFVMQVMGDIPCIPGLFVAGVFSGALSTVSSGLNSLAAVTLQDFILSHKKVSLTETQKTWITKGLAVAYGILSYCATFGVQPGVLEAALAIFGIVGGPILGAFFLGMFFPWANSVGTFVGAFTSLIFTMWIGFGAIVAKYAGTIKPKVRDTFVETTTELCPTYWNITAPEPKTIDESFTHIPIYEVSYIWYSAIACTVSIIIGIIVSFATKFGDPKKVNPALISPAFYSFFKIFPQSVRDWIEDLEIGSEFVEGEKEQRLRDQQMIQSPKNNKNEEIPMEESTAKQNNGFTMEDEKK